MLKHVTVFYSLLVKGDGGKLTRNSYEGFTVQFPYVTYVGITSMALNSAMCYVMYSREDSGLTGK